MRGGWRGRWGASSPGEGRGEGTQALLELLHQLLSTPEYLTVKLNKRSEEKRRTEEQSGTDVLFR